MSATTTEVLPVPSDLFEADAPAANPEPIRDSFGYIDVLLRDRPRFLSLLDDEASRTTIARTMLLTIVLGAAAFGVATGFYRGGWQILVAGLKFPLIQLIMAVICAPALSALNAAVHGKTDVRRDFVLLLSSFALTSLVMAGLAPFMLLAGRYSLDYHRTALVMFGSCGIGGLFGVSLLLNGLQGGTQGGRRIVGWVLALVALVVGSQVAWVFRPYIGRPAQHRVPILRAAEGNLVNELGTTLRSARGDYDRSLE